MGPRVGMRCPAERPPQAQREMVVARAATEVEEAVGRAARPLATRFANRLRVELVGETSLRDRFLP